MKTYTEKQLAEIIIRTLEENGIKPNKDFTACSGVDYGYVKAYALAETDNYAIGYGDNAETNYAIAANTEDLGEWLISQDLSGLDSLINRASVYGIGSIDAAPDDSTDLCAVLISRDFYGPYSRISVAMEDDGQHEAEFDGAAAARAWIEKEEEYTYVLSHNESNRPTYKVVAL